MSAAVKPSHFERCERLTDRLNEIRGVKKLIEATLVGVENKLGAADRYGADLITDGCYPLRCRMNELRLERLDLTARAVRFQLRRVELLVSRTEDRLLRLVNGKPKSLRQQREEGFRRESIARSPRPPCGAYRLTGCRLHAGHGGACQKGGDR